MKTFHLLGNVINIYLIFSNTNKILYTGTSIYKYHCPGFKINVTDIYAQVLNLQDNIKFLLISSKIMSEIPIFCYILKQYSSIPYLRVFSLCRCVPQHDSSLALGIQWIIARCLGKLFTSHNILCLVRSSQKFAMCGKLCPILT